MERRVTVEFGPSRSKRFAKAVAAAQSGPGECQELEPSRYRVSFVLGTDAGVYIGLARLLQWTRDWAATEVYEGEEPLPSFHTREMAWCASSQLKLFAVWRLPAYLSGIAPANKNACSAVFLLRGVAIVRLLFFRKVEIDM